MESKKKNQQQRNEIFVKERKRSYVLRIALHTLSSYRMRLEIRFEARALNDQIKEWMKERERTIRENGALHTHYFWTNSIHWLFSFVAFDIFFHRNVCAVLLILFGSKPSSTDTRTTMAKRAEMQERKEII